ncbi:MAG TPA: 2-C-methyl-D-erythritol 4-phosphate cytidylyltransferase [Dissulfurispiraceae bacterium]|nr:2-C-methyl-D-erythritol 4-phosphate cytidylyltransferase [Dissulfurispiraceae bacterium]
MKNKSRNPSPHTVAIIAAAGIGKRFGRDRSKQFVPLAGKPVLIWSLEALAASNLIDEIIPVVHSDEIESTVALLNRFKIPKILRVVPGGRERQDSVMNGLAAAPPKTEIVVVHDGARPLVATRHVDAAISALHEIDGVVLGVPVKDTIKDAERDHYGAIVLKTIERSRLWAIQTPQVFRRELLFSSLQRAQAEGFIGTDDASVIERYGGTVRIVVGSYRNIKITTPEDLCVAEALLSAPRAEEPVE